jgi:carboxypeptidase-like protein/TonB-dependent receptor-like protein
MGLLRIFRTVRLASRTSICFAVGLVTTLLLSPVAEVAAQRGATISGFVRDAETGETLILANLILEGTTIGAATNTSGFFSISGLAPGEYTIMVSYLGYMTYSRVTVLSAGQQLRLDVEMQGTDIVSEEVVVEADRDGLDGIQRISVAQLTTETIRSLPAVLEADVFRSLQFLPGVKAASDYSSGLYIRGGSPDQTLILLDRTTVYNPTHFFGFFSTFNPDAIKDVRLFKGGFPAEYGGRIGSVVDIYNKDGNRRKREGRLSLGLLASRAMLEGPHPWGSYMVAFRRSTLEPVLAVLRGADIDGIPDGFYFFDINAKVNLDIGANDKVSVSTYSGRDVLDLPVVDSTRLLLAYGNRTVSLNWTHLFSGSLFSNFTLTSSRYFSKPDFLIASTTFTRDNTVDDLSARGDFEYMPNEAHTFKAGFWGGIFTLNLQDLFDGNVRLEERIHSPYGSAYLEHVYEPAPGWELISGLRASYFGNGRFLRLEPRVSLERKLSRSLRLQAGYGRYAQYVTLISSEAFSGLDLWLTTDDGVDPSTGDQFVVGIKSRPTESTGIELEAYFRTMNNLFQLDPFLVDGAGVDYADLFHFGDGFAYGVEIFAQRTARRISGFLGYTFGVTKRRFPNLNDGKYFSPKYDRTHDVKGVLTFDMTSKWRATTAFTYGTGQAYTQPASYFRLVDSPFGSEASTAFVSPFNGARLPAYHRLDLGVTRRGSLFGADYELQIQVINAYARRNVWFNLFEFEEDAVSRTEVPQIPVPVPNVSFSVHF